MQRMSTDEGLCEVGDAKSAKRELAAAKALRERIGGQMVRKDPRGQTAPSQIGKSNSDELLLA